MFLQVFQGQVDDVGRLRHRLDDWAQRLGPAADGWLGSTAGVTDDGAAVCVTRFVSPAAARRSGGRAQQGEWLAGLEKLFAGGMRVHGCREVDVARRGGSDAATFVQVVQGRTRDVARLRVLTASFDRRFPALRPDLLGVVSAVHDGEDGAFTQVAYFTSERAARVGERVELPDEAAEALRRERHLLQDLTYHDLREPWLYSPL